MLLLGGFVSGKGEFGVLYNRMSICSGFGKGNNIRGTTAQLVIRF